MTIGFLLMPIEPKNSEAWAPSRYADVCMVFADSPDEARRAAATTFLIEGHVADSPWLNSMLATCREAAVNGQALPIDYRGVHFIGDRLRK